MTYYDTSTTSTMTFSYSGTDTISWVELPPRQEPHEPDLTDENEEEMYLERLGV